MDSKENSSTTAPKKERGVLLRVINDLEYIVSAAALLALVFLLAISIASRYGLGISVPWSEEMSRFMFIAVIFSSISYAASQHRHIRITMFIEKFFFKSAQKVILTIGDIFWLIFNFVVIFGAFQNIQEFIQYPEASPVLRIPIVLIYALIPIFFITISIRVAQGIHARHTGTDVDAIGGEAI